MANRADRRDGKAARRGHFSVAIASRDKVKRLSRRAETARRGETRLRRSYEFVTLRFYECNGAGVPLGANGRSDRLAGPFSVSPGNVILCRSVKASANARFAVPLMY